MKTFLVKLKVVFLFILFSSSISLASEPSPEANKLLDQIHAKIADIKSQINSSTSLASEISPEAEKLLDQIHAKTTGIKSLSWEIEGKSPSYTTNGYYKQGGFLRLQMRYPFNEAQSDYFITPEKSLSYNARMGEITESAGMNISFNAWFFLPLLDKNTLKSWGEVTAKKESIENKNYVVLEMSFKTTPQTRSNLNRNLRFYFDTEGLKLEKVEYIYGPGSTQILKVKDYERIGEYDFPVKIETTNYSLSVVNIQINPNLSEDLFKLEDKNTLTYFNAYSEEEINSKLSKNPDDPNLHYTLAKLFSSPKREFPKAIQEYKKTITLKPNAKAAYFGLASAYLNAKQYDEAIKIYEELIVKFPEDKRNCLSSLMGAYQQAGRNDDAIKTAEEYLKENPDQAHAYTTVANLYNNLKDYDKAIQMYKKALELEENVDNQANYLMQIGQIYIQQKKYEEAVQAYEDAKTKSKQEWVQQNADSQIAELYRQMGKIDELTNKYEAKLKETPENVELLKQLAEIYSRNKQYEKGVELYNKVLKIEPENRNILNQLASAYQNAKQYDKAIELYEELIVKFPENKQNYLSSLIWVYQQAGRNDDAIKTAEEYLKENPDQAYAYSTAANLYQNSKNYDKAIELYRKAIEMEKNVDNQANYLLQIGQIYIQQKKYDEAVQAYEEAKTKSKQEWVQQTANSQIAKLFSQISSKIDIDSSLIQKELNSLVPEDNQVRNEMNTRIAKAVTYRNDNPNQSCYIVIGQLTLDGDGNVQSDVKTQTDILSGGYFVALVKDPTRPLSFRMYDYKPLDVNLNAIIKQPFANIGILHLSPLKTEEESSLFGKVVLEGNENVSDIKIYANIRQSYNTPCNCIADSYGRYENLNYNQAPIRIAVDASGTLQGQGFSPTEYIIVISAPGYLGQAIPVNLQPGKKLNLGTILLELPKKLNLEYTGSWLDGNKEKITLVPDKRWQPQLNGYWSLSFLQKDGKLSLKSNYGPWYAIDLGKGTLDDFKGIENTDKVLLDRPSNFEIKDGYVYFVKSYEGKWLLFKAKID